MKNKATTLIECLSVIVLGFLFFAIIYGFITYDPQLERVPDPYLNPKQAEIYWQQKQVEAQEEQNRLMRELLLKDKQIEK